MYIFKLLNKYNQIIYNRSFALNIHRERNFVSKKKLIKVDEVIPSQLRKVVVAQRITSDLVLEIYEKAKKARGVKRKENLHKVAETLSKHIGKFLVE